MTPLQLRLLLDIHTGSVGLSHPVREARHAQPASPWYEAIVFFLDNELIAVDTDHDTWKMTERGRAFITFILSTPLPVASWSIPETTRSLSTRMFDDYRT